MKFLISANSLHRMIYNCKLLDLKAYLHFDLTPASLQVSSWDGTEYLCDWGALLDDHSVDTLAQWSMPPKEVKDLENDLRGADEDLEIEIEPGEAMKFRWGSYHAVREYPDMSMLFDLDQQSAPHDSSDWALSPKRMRKFPLFKPGDYPIDFRRRFHAAADCDVLYYRVGPKLKGAMLTLDRDDLMERTDPNCFW